MNALIIRTMRTRHKQLDSIEKDPTPSTNEAPKFTSDVEPYVNTTIELNDRTDCHREQKRSNTLGKSKGESKRQLRSSVQEQEFQLIVMLLGVSFAVLILTLPIYLRQFVYQYVDPYTSVEGYSLYFFLFFFTQMLYFTNSCVNFYLYCLTGSKFREDLKSIICKQSDNKNKRPNDKYI